MIDIRGCSWFRWSGWWWSRPPGVAMRLCQGGRQRPPGIAGLRV